MNADTILGIIALIVAFITLCGVAALFFTLKRREENDGAARLSEELEKEIGSLSGGVSETKEIVLQSIRIYNESVLSQLKDIGANSKTAQSDLERRFAEFIANIEMKLNNMRREITDGMADVRKENQSQLDKMRLTVDEKLTSTLNERLGASFEVISRQLDMVSKGLGEMRSLSDGVGSLNKVLSNVKTRGSWGELSLDNILSQILTSDRYVSQLEITRGSRVDFAVVLPGDGKDKVYLPIDAKFPLEDYERLVDASEKGDRQATEAAAKALAVRLKEEAKSIKEKYIKPPETTDFAILYLPIEGLFAEAVKKPGLADELQNKYRVVLCGPTTVTALLNSLQMGFKTLAIQRHSGEVWQLLSAFKNEFGKFSEMLLAAKRQVDTVSNTIENANKKTATIQKKLDKVEKFAPEEIKSLGDGLDI